jgi:hypothetical protein
VESFEPKLILDCHEVDGIMCLDAASTANTLSTANSSWGKIGKPGPGSTGKTGTSLPRSTPVRSWSSSASKCDLTP